MKKIIYMLLIALVLTGCGNQETDKKTNEVVQSELEGNEEAPEVGEELGEEVETTEETPENSTQTPEITQPTVTKNTMYAKSSVNVRSGAGTSHSKVGSLAKGQEVVKIGEENGWSEIEFNGGTGYVNSNYLSTEKVEVSMNNSNTGNSNSSNNNSGSTNNTSSNNTGTTTQPVHEHNWVEVTEDEIHYYAWRTICGKCGEDLTDMSEDDRLLHVTIICRSRYGTVYKEVDFVTENVVKKPVVTGYKCECGAEKK